MVILGSLISFLKCCKSMMGFEITNLKNIFPLLFIEVFILVIISVQLFLTFTKFSLFFL